MKTALYIRKFDFMDIGLVLIKISSNKHNLGLFFHFLYSDEKKPSMDIAFNSKDKSLEYFSFFLQNEKIKKINNSITISKGENFFSIPDTVNERNYHHYENAAFKPYLIENSLLIIKDGNINDSFTSFGLDKQNYFLFNEQKFVGILLNNLESEEIKQLILSCGIE